MESFTLRENEIWISQNKVRSIEKFEKAVLNTGMLKSAYSIPLDKVYEVKFNEGDESLLIRYVNEKEKNKKLNIAFDDEPFSNKVGVYLGEKLGFSKQVEVESKIKPLLINGLILLFSIGATVVFGLMEDPGAEVDVDSGSRRNRGGRQLMKFLFETIGQTGVIILGTAISLYLAYQLYQRYKSPTNVITYK